jgi:undecaprenyl diphosphate synthase
VTEIFFPMDSMMQRTLQGPKPAFSGLHVGIIMDGNGRWAQQRHRPRAVGHRIGSRAVRGIVEAAPGLGIGTLTLFAFSSDNWSRPAHEVKTLFRLFRTYLRSEIDRCMREGVRFRAIGRRSRLPTDLLREIEALEERTRAGRRLRLRIAIDYSSRAAIVGVVRRAAWSRGEPDVARLLADEINDDLPTSDLDLLIRTGGEQRLSDFMLWESAYAELYFTDVGWPDFGGDQLAEAVAEFRRRDRRFGRICPESRKERSAS